MDSSKFNVFRACIAFFHIDQKLVEKEKLWIEEKKELLKFTPEQKAILLNDLKTPESLEVIIPHITKPSDRAFLVDQMRIIARIDGDFTASEKKAITEIKAMVLSKVNMPEIEKMVIDEGEKFRINNKETFLDSINKKMLEFLDG